MRLVSFVRFNPRYIMLIKIIAIVLILALVLPKVFFLVKEAISPWFTPQEPLDTQKVGKIVAGDGGGFGFLEKLWFNLIDFYRKGINIYIN